MAIHICNLDGNIFSSSRCEELVVIQRILKMLELSLGFKIIFSKSMLVRVGCLDELI